MNEIHTLNVEEACLFLKIHRSTLYEKIATGEIPAAKVGKAWVFVAQTIIHLIAAIKSSTYRIKLCPTDGKRRHNPIFGPLWRHSLDIVHGASIGAFSGVAAAVLPKSFTA